MMPAHGGVPRLCPGVEGCKGRRCHRGSVLLHLFTFRGAGVLRGRGELTPAPHHLRSSAPLSAVLGGDADLAHYPGGVFLQLPDHRGELDRFRTRAEDR